VADAVTAVGRALDRSGVRAVIRRFDEPVPSAAAAAEQLGCPVGAIANSLLFRAGEGVVLVLASGAHRVDLARVAAHLGLGRKKIRRADPDTVHAVTGQHVGGVAPVGHPTRLPCLIDTALTEHDVVWAGAGDEHSMFATTADDLVALTDGTLLDLGERPARAR
jgi:prolyl-tRNA editing enzyme YbaK/EbsC (Cys-tRNA(Pro) deacylase)